MIGSARLPLLIAALVAGGSLFGCSEPRATPADAETSSGDVTAGAAALVAPPLTPATTPRTLSPTGAPVAETPGVDADAVAPAEVIDGGPRGLTAGARGAAAGALENRLAALRFNPGKSDGAYDSHLVMAVMAFQKQQALPRTGRADPATLARLAVAPLGPRWWPPPRGPGSRST